jgi:hypothetical protein
MVSIRFRGLARAVVAVSIAKGFQEWSPERQAAFDIGLPAAQQNGPVSREPSLGNA